MPPLTLLTGIYGLFGYHFLLFFAFRQAPALEANLLNYLWPLLIVMLSPLLRPGTRLTRRHIIGGAMGFVGAGLIVTGGKLALSQQYLTGYLLAISAAMVWSTFSLLLGRLPAFSGSAMGGFCLASGLLSLLCHAMFESRHTPAPRSGRRWPCWDLDRWAAPSSCGSARSGWETRARSARYPIRRRCCPPCC